MHTGTRSDTHLLSRHMVVKALCVQCQSMHLWCGTPVKDRELSLPPSATPEVHIRDNTTTVILPHLSRLQPHLKCLCPGGSAPARKPAVQENVRQGLHDVQNYERSCRRKPPLQVCWSPNTAAPGGASTYSKSPTPEKTRTCILTSHRQFDSGTLSPHVLHQQRLPAFRSALTGWMEGRT